MWMLSQICFVVSCDVKSNISVTYMTQGIRLELGMKAVIFARNIYDLSDRRVLAYRFPLAQAYGISYITMQRVKVHTALVVP